MSVQMYPEPAEQAKKLALFGMAGALANTIALVLAGVFLLASWRWYFRFIVSFQTECLGLKLTQRRSSLHLVHDAQDYRSC
jgi:predicted tellurium resistance membrane protein TerC